MEKSISDKIKLRPLRLAYGDDIPDITSDNIGMIKKEMASILIDKSINEKDLPLRIKSNICCCRKKEQEIPNLYESWKFSDFENLIDDNIEWILENLDTRWKLSILECYINNGTESQNIVAFYSSLISHLSKINSTFLYMNDFDVNPSKIVKEDDDAPINFHIRIKPHLHKSGSAGLLSKSIFNDYKQNDKFTYNHAYCRGRLTYDSINDVINSKSNNPSELFEIRNFFFE